eukprot:scaffold9836_cov97-Isochrysis_galbana.AAC.5
MRARGGAKVCLRSGQGEGVGGRRMVRRAWRFRTAPTSRTDSPNTTVLSVWSTFSVPNVASVATGSTAEMRAANTPASRMGKGVAVQPSWPA